MYPVKFKPVPKQRIWGGHTLKSLFQVEENAPVGEYWVVSGHPNGISVVSDGPFQGMTLEQLTREYPKDYLGASMQPRFPLLIKFLEAERDLSVQIHPDDEYAKQHEGDFGKSEAWFVLDAKPGARVNYGHTFPNRQAYESAVENGLVKDYLSYRSIHTGDFVYVPAGTLHALLAGTKVIEIQQTSDVTYRVYDWDRVDETGKPRDLHTAEAANVLTYGAQHEEMKPRVLKQDESLVHTRMAQCKHFTIDLMDVHDCSTVQFGRTGNPDVLIVVSGRGQLSYSVNEEQRALSLSPGEAVLVPAGMGGYQLIPETNVPLKILRTFY